VKLTRIICNGMLACVLAGCAGDQAFREAQRLIAEQRQSEALAPMEQAVKANPDSASYRMSLLRLRAKVTSDLLDQARIRRDSGDFDGADEAYRRVLQADANNDAAVLGLKATERERAWDVLVTEAERGFEHNQLALARAQVQAVLAQNGRHPRALRLLQKMDLDAAEPRMEAALGPAYQKTLTLEFKDASLKTVFEVLAKSSGLNFVFDKDVRTDQLTSIFLRNTTVQSAVSRMLISNQLAQRVLDASTVLIYPDTPAKQKDYQLLNVRSFYLSNADAKSVAGSIKSVLKVKDVVVDDRLNLVMVRDTPEAVRLVERMVALLDLAEPEVMLEVEVIEVKRSALMDLGVRWPDSVSLTPLSTRAGAQLTLSDLRHLNASTVGVTVPPVTVSARQDNATTNILANPRIRAKNREKARILIGDRVPNITTTQNATGFVSDSVNYLDVGLKLEVEPVIYADHEVTIKLALEVSNIVSQVQTKNGTLAYQIGTRMTSTVLRLRDGENQMLAGLINDEDRRSANAIPWLGAAPFLGRLFGGQSDEAVKTEIMLSITPRLLRTAQRPEARLLNFESGTDTQLRSASDGAVVPATSNAGAPAAVSAERPAVGSSPMAEGRKPASAPPGPSASNESVGAAAAVADVQLRWDGAGTVKRGQVFKIDLMADAHKPVIALPVALGFDPDVLDVLSVDEGDWMSQGGTATKFERRIDPSGQVLATLRRDGATGTIGGGRVLSLTVRALKVADASLLRVLTVAPEGLEGQLVSGASPAPLRVEVQP